MGEPRRQGRRTGRITGKNAGGASADGRSQQRVEPVDGQQVDRVGIEQPGLEPRGIDAGRGGAPAVRKLDPLPMVPTQDRGMTVELVHDGRSARAGLDPGTEDAHQSQAGGVGVGGAPAAFVFDHATPQRHRSHHRGRRVRRHRVTGEVLEGAVRVDAASAPLARTLVDGASDREQPVEAAPSRGGGARLPGVRPHAGAGREQPRRPGREMPRTPADDGLVGRRDDLEGPGCTHRSRVRPTGGNRKGAAGR